MLRKFIIEREVPGIGTKDADGFREIARKSNQALARLGTDIQWLESFVIADKTYCVYLATDEAVIRDHAASSGFPANRIEAVRTVLDPSTAAA